MMEIDKMTPEENISQNLPTNLRNHIKKPTCAFY